MKKVVGLILCALVTIFLNYEDEFKKFIYDNFYQSYEMENIPLYNGNNYVIINNNVPNFSEEDLLFEGEYYSNLDLLGRCGYAIARITEESMPTEERTSIGMIKPSGWHTIRIDDNYLYNRCHLIGYQLTGENANENNLITCTRQMNNEGMLPFENEIAQYIKDTDNSVLYRVTPIFEGSNLLAKGVQIEAKSIEDDTINFNVFVYNVFDGIELNYADGTIKE